MQEINISKDNLRKYLVLYQGLGNTNRYGSITEFVKKVGCIQYDPLNVVGRNSELVLQSRFSNYRPEMLKSLLYETRELIDAWDKMMSIYSAGDWPYFYRLRERKREEIEGVLRNRNSSEGLNYIDEVREYIHENGPSMPSQINLGSVSKGSWGHGKLSSIAMDYMFNIGTLGISDKKNTQKVYDLIENLLPKDFVDAEDPFTDDEEFFKWYIKRRIGSIGIYWERSGGGWLGGFISKKKLRLDLLKELHRNNELCKVIVDDLNEVFYMRTEDMKLFDDIKSESFDKVSFLAPLDNLLWDRKLIKDVFDFEYVWEVYKPIKQRLYGYYVLPVLYGDKLIARFEPELHRQSGPLVVKSWWWEDGFEVTEESLVAIKLAFDSFCEYLNADGLSTESQNKIFNDKDMIKINIK